MSAQVLQVPHLSQADFANRMALYALFAIKAGAAQGQSIVQVAETLARSPNLEDRVALAIIREALRVPSITH